MTDQAQDDRLGMSRKLGLKPGLRVSLLNVPDGWTLAGAPLDLEWVQDGPADVVLCFVTELADVVASYPALGERIRPAGALWLAWPRRAGGHVSDINGDRLRELILPSGLVDNKNAALDVDWSALRFVWRRELR